MTYLHLNDPRIPDRFPLGCPGSRGMRQFVILVEICHFIGFSSNVKLSSRKLGKTYLHVAESRPSTLLFTTLSERGGISTFLSCVYPLADFSNLKIGLHGAGITRSDVWEVSRCSAFYMDSKGWKGNWWSRVGERHYGKSFRLRAVRLKRGGRAANMLYQ